MPFYSLHTPVIVRLFLHWLDLSTQNLHIMKLFLCLLLCFLFLSISASAQPYLRLADSLVASVEPRPILNVFKNERQAGAWLTVGGVASMAVGSWIQGRAAKSIQLHGHSRDFDSYGMTRGTGLSLQLVGAASAGAGFAYRSKRWYRKRPVLWGCVETVVLFGVNCWISQYSYRRR